MSLLGFESFRISYFLFESTYSIPLEEFYFLFIKPPYSYRSFALGSCALTCVVFFSARFECTQQRLQGYKGYKGYRGRTAPPVVPCGVPACESARCPVVCHLASLLCAGRAKSMGYRDTWDTRDALGCWGAFFSVIFIFFSSCSGWDASGGAFASLLGAELSGLSALCAAVPCGVPPFRESTRRMDAWMCPCGVHSF